MTAALKRFLWFWLPMLVVLLVGLVRAWRTGQVDPWDWGVVALAMAAIVGLLLARRGWAVLAWAALGLAGPVLIFCALAARRMPDMLAEGVPEAEQEISFEAGVRYSGQAFEVSLPLVLDGFEAAGLETLGAAFDKEHERLFTFCLESDRE
ncbi:MAG TPA: hypothetical protein VMR39_01360, partial [Sphingobium sp.]|nr:hypothetical protein [Sphingobium sp.]